MIIITKFRSGGVCMDWFLERGWELTYSSGNSILMVYIIYITFLITFFRFLMEKYPWKDYLRIPRWRNSIVVIVILPAISIGVFFYEPARWYEKLPVIMSALLLSGFLIWNLLKKTDIEEYLAVLPADAVYLRGDLQQELVGISHYENEYPLKKYSFEQNKELMLSTRDIYESNG